MYPDLYPDYDGPYSGGLDGHSQLRLVGKLLIAFGVLDGVANGVAIGLASPYGWMNSGWETSGIWDGMVFGVLFGALCLVGGQTLPHITYYWTNVCIGIGAVSLLMHVANLVMAILRLVWGIYNYNAASSSSTTKSLYAGVVVCDVVDLLSSVILVALDIVALVVLSRFRYRLRAVRNFPEPLY